MNRFMGNDRTYEYFQKALSEWIERKRKDNEAPQKILAIELNTHEGTISKYLNPDRKKPIPFERQVSLANACGFDYLDFLQLGRELIEGPAEKPEPNLGPAKIEPADPVVSIHRDLTNEFEDKKLAKEINQNLIKIEAMNQKKYWMLAGKIENIAEELKGVDGKDEAQKNKGEGKSKMA